MILFFLPLDIFADNFFHGTQTRTVCVDEKTLTKLENVRKL